MNAEQEHIDPWCRGCNPEGQSPYQPCARHADAQPEPDLTPIPAEEVWAAAEVVEGVPLLYLGEDGEQCITPGHRVTDEEYANALAAYTDTDPEQYSGFEAKWLVARRHMPDCREDLDADEECGCGEADWAWWGSLAAPDEPGAIKVTWWSA